MKILEQNFSNFFIFVEFQFLLDKGFNIWVKNLFYDIIELKNNSA